MNIFQLISDARYNRKLRKSGLERPGEVRLTPGWGPDWKPIDPYADEHTTKRSTRLVTTLSQKEIEQ